MSRLMNSRPLRDLPRAFRELIGYGLGTTVAFVVDVALLTWLHEVAGLHYLVSAACGFMIGGIVLYLISVRWVFTVRRIDQPRVELPAFLALGLVGLLVQMATIYLAVRYLGWFYLYAKLAAAGFTFVTNFLLRRSLLFSRPAGLLSDV
jgi:putative flippase GtrA